MKDYYVYIHLNPTNNEIFYVGKGKGHRKSAKKSRNKKWLEYVSKLTEPFKILILKDKLTEQEALNLEEKILKKIDWHYNDLITNIDGSEPYGNGILIEIDFGELIEDEEQVQKEARFQNYSDSEIIATLIDFPNSNEIKKIEKSFDSIFDFFHNNYDELEELDEDVFLDLETVIDTIKDLIEEYEVADKENLKEFKSDLKREREDVEMILDDNPTGIQKKFINKTLNWIDEYI